MSKSANIVAASLLNRHYATIRIGRFNFRVYQPRIKDLARAFSKERTDLSIDGRQTLLLIRDSQGGYGKGPVHLKDYIRVLILPDF